jgi:hypothetical protein
MPEPEPTVDAAEQALWDATEVPRMTEEELRVLARQVVTNEVFLTNKADGMLAFDFILTMTIPKMKAPYTADIGAVWEEYAKAGPRRVNGMPMFMSMHLVSVRDWDILIGFIRDMEKALGIPPMAGEHGES